ncbi:hypothetical protein WJX73_008903 [Symbiochloris irregularis]|uniref:WH2 domain-containing protein n=1 Tax=Symbiochloris irregularis TaxID=706552 RepID=A0AAW1NNU8_9CHLO
MQPVARAQPQPAPDEAICAGIAFLHQLADLLERTATLHEEITGRAANVQTRAQDLTGRCQAVHQQLSTPSGGKEAAPPSEAPQPSAPFRSPFSLVVGNESVAVRYMSTAESIKPREYTSAVPTMPALAAIGESSRRHTARSAGLLASSSDVQNLMVSGSSWEGARIGTGILDTIQAEEQEGGLLSGHTRGDSASPEAAASSFPAPTQEQDAQAWNGRHVKGTHPATDAASKDQAPVKTIASPLGPYDIQVWMVAIPGPEGSPANDHNLETPRADYGTVVIHNTAKARPAMPDWMDLKTSTYRARTDEEEQARAAEAAEHLMSHRPAAVARHAPGGFTSDSRIQANWGSLGPGRGGPTQGATTMPHSFAPTGQSPMSKPQPAMQQQQWQGVNTAPRQQALLDRAPPSVSTQRPPTHQPPALFNPHGDSPSSTPSHGARIAAHWDASGNPFAAGRPNNSPEIPQASAIRTPIIGGREPRFMRKNTFFDGAPLGRNVPFLNPMQQQKHESQLQRQLSGIHEDLRPTSASARATPQPTMSHASTQGASHTRTHSACSSTGSVTGGHMPQQQPEQSSGQAFNQFEHGSGLGSRAMATTRPGSAALRQRTPPQQERPVTPSDAALQRAIQAGVGSHTKNALALLHSYSNLSDYLVENQEQAPSDQDEPADHPAVYSQRSLPRPSSAHPPSRLAADSHLNSNLNSNPRGASGSSSSSSSEDFYDPDTSPDKFEELMAAPMPWPTLDLEAEEEARRRAHGRSRSQLTGSEFLLQDSAGPLVQHESRASHGLRGEKEPAPKAHQSRTGVSATASHAATQLAQQLKGMSWADVAPPVPAASSDESAPQATSSGSRGSAVQAPPATASVGFKAPPPPPPVPPAGTLGGIPKAPPKAPPLPPKGGLKAAQPMTHLVLQAVQASAPGPAKTPAKAPVIAAGALSDISPADLKGGMARLKPAAARDTPAAAVSKAGPGDDLRTQLMADIRAKAGKLNSINKPSSQRTAAKSPAPRAQHQAGAPAKRSSVEGSSAAKLSGIGLMMAQARNLRQRFYAESTVGDSDSDWEDS